MSIPTPHRARAEQTLRQTVTVSVAGVQQVADHGGAGRAAAEVQPPEGDAAPIRAEIGGLLGRRLPPIGVMMAAHGDAPSAREMDLLRRLRLAHLHVDLRLADPSYREALARAGAAATALGAALEPAIFAPDDADGETALAACAALLASLPVPLARVLVFADAAGRSATAGSTPASLMRRARAALGPALPGVPLAGGTDLFFAELNRDRPAVSEMDAVVYAVNPQVHACDDASLVENLAAQAETVAMARTFCGGRPILVGPVTLIGRAGPYAAGPPDPGGLPGNVDARQASLFGAGWTLGSVKYLAEAGAAALTYYETTGPLGLVERDEGPPRPDLFPSRPGDVYPLYHVFADLAEWGDGELVELRTGDPLAVDGLAVRVDGALRVLVANMGHDPRTVEVGPFDATRVRVRMLDEQGALLAMADPARFRASGAPHETRDRTLALALPPYAVARIDEGAAASPEVCAPSSR